MTASPLVPCITLGAGRNRSIGRARHGVAGVADLAAAITPLRQRDAWWAGSQYAGDHRASDNWQSGHILGTDVDHHGADGEKAPLGDEVYAVARDLLLPICTGVHKTPHGARVVHILTTPTTDRDAFMAASRGAAALVAEALRTLPQLAVDPACVADAARLFFAPCARVNGAQRQAQIEVGGKELWSLAELVALDSGDKSALAPVVAPAVDLGLDPAAQLGIVDRLARRDGGSEFADAAAQYNRGHTPTHGWGEPGKGACPVCGHHDCFGALPKIPARWCCFSANHGDVGLPLVGGKGRHGDALDLEVHRRGLPPGGASRAAVLRDEGYLQVTRASTVTTSGVPGQAVSPPSIAPYEPPPIDVLPPPARALVEHAARSIDCDPAFVLLPALATMSAAIGATRAIALRPGQVESVLLWCCTIARSGTGKTPALGLATGPIKARERRARKEHRQAMRDYERAMAEWERARRQGKGAIQEKPQKPPAPRWYTSDATIEKVAVMLEDTPRGFLLARDELGGWFSFDRYAKAKGAEQPAWLSIHSGETIAVDRKDETRVFVDRPFVAVVGGIQPGVLRGIVAAEPTIIESGLLGRVLLAHPPTWQRKWNDNGVPDHVRRRWAQFIDSLCDLEMEATGDDGDEDGGLRPVVVGMTEAAKQVWREWFARVQEGVETSPTDSERAAWAKIETAAARLALILHLGRQACDPTLGATVDRESMEAGVRLAEWFARESGRVYAVLHSVEVDVVSQLLERVRRFAAKHGRGPTPADWARQTQRGDRDMAAADRELQKLVDARAAVWEDTTGPGPKTRRLVLLASPLPTLPQIPRVEDATGETCGIRGIVGSGERREVDAHDAELEPPETGLQDDLEGADL